MKAFQFRLERVLSWKRKRSDAEQARLDTLLAEVARLQGHLQALELELATAGTQALARPGLSGGDLHALQSYYYGLERQCQRTVAEIADAERRAAEQRRVLTAARMEVRLFEKLRERDMSAWQSAFNLEIEALGAESVLARTARQLRRPSGG